MSCVSSIPGDHRFFHAEKKGMVGFSILTGSAVARACPGEQSRHRVELTEPICCRFEG